MNVLEAIVADADEMHNAVEKPGPRRCCAEFGIVKECDGETDSMWCGICLRTWTRPCPDLELVSR